MPRTSRFALLAVLALALAGGLAMAGCGRAQPGTAAYVGATRYTEQRVNDLIDDARAAGAIEKFDDARRSVVSWLVLGDLARRAATQRSIPVPPADYTAAAQSLNVDPKLALVRVYGDWLAARDALADNVEPVAPSEEELREIYQYLRAGGQLPPSTVYEQVAAQLRASRDLPVRVGVRNVLRETRDAVGLVIGPRYRPLSGNVLGIPLALADGSTTVTELDRG